MKYLLISTCSFCFLFAPCFLLSGQHQRDVGGPQSAFMPYFTGPILTPSAHNASPGEFLVQPYIFLKNRFANFNDSRRSEKITHLLILKESLTYQMGLSDFLDFSAVLNAEQRWQDADRSSGLGDTQIEFGVQLMREKENRPALRLTITESLPTGKYQNLTPGKESLQAIGSGSYETSIAFNITKMVHWMWHHPLSVRASLQYTIPAPLNVQGFNAYGGGFETKGRARPGQSMGIGTSIEISLTQKLALACDLAYAYQGRSRFSGEKGYSKTGDRAQVTLPASDSLSCAPAIEYSVSEKMGFLAGAWFTITGRNSPQFVTGVLTMTYSW